MRVWQAFDMEETNDDLSLVLRLKNSAGESLKSRSLVNIKPGASFCYNKLFQFFFLFRTLYWRKKLLLHLGSSAQATPNAIFA